MEKVKEFLGNLKQKISDAFGGRIYIPIAIGVAALILIVVAVAGLTSRGNSKSAETVSPGMLTVAIVSAEDRYAYHDKNGNLLGIEPSYATALAEAENLTVKIIEVKDAQEAISLIDTKACDVAFGRISSANQLSGYSISNNYGNSGLFMITALHDYTDSLNLMTGYSVGIMNNVKSLSTAINNIDYVSVKDYESALTLGEDIAGRVISLGVASERDAIELIKNFPNALQTQEIAGGPTEYYVAVFPIGGSVHASILNGIINSASLEQE